MIRAPPLQVPDSRRHRPFTNVYQIQPDFVDLEPALSAGVLEGEVDVGEGLVDFGVQVGGNLAGRWVPAACLEWLREISELAMGVEMYLGRQVRWSRLRGRLDCTTTPHAWLRRSRGSCSTGGETCFLMITRVVG
jgi:hypothetical protein